MRSTRVAPDLSSSAERVSDTVSTAILSGMNVLLSSMPGMADGPVVGRHWGCSARPCGTRKGRSYRSERSQIDGPTYVSRAFEIDVVKRHRRQQCLEIS